MGPGFETTAPGEGSGGPGDVNGGNVVTIPQTEPGSPVSPQPGDAPGGQTAETAQGPGDVGLIPPIN